MSRHSLIEKNRPEKFLNTILNADTATIKQGTPLVLNLSSTPQPSTYQNGLPAGSQDGLQVVNPSTAGANPSNYLLYGVLVSGDLLPNLLGDAQIHNVVSAARITVMTRGATNASAASVASVASGQFLVVDTTNNSFVTTATISAGQQHAYLLDTIGSVQSKASNDSAWATNAVIQSYRVFVRQM